MDDTISRQQVIHCKDCRWRNDVGHWLGCPILNGDDDNYCSVAESEVNISFVPVSEFFNAEPSCNLTDEQLKELHDAFI